jgi:hypothetical protein
MVGDGGNDSGRWAGAVCFLWDGLKSLENHRKMEVFMGKP